ncbi:VanZ family protein [Dysgonomonas massiliensis]|uniref:VanZ family protein n=1 Tax=Dysgonomonas massiliensis TaxID=2040292 RepID=UPI000C762E40|nr:VanZ family protein [Dysgonomonas massiliensis]
MLQAIWNFIKYTWAPFVVAAIIFYLCCLISVDDMPEAGFELFVHADKAVHFLMFFGLSLVASCNYVYLNKGKIIILKMIFFAILLPIIYGGLIEVIQHEYFPNRYGDWFDFLADSLGAISAIPFALILRRKLLIKYHTI